MAKKAVPEETIGEFIERTGIRKTDLAIALGVTRQNLRAMETKKSCTYRIRHDGKRVHIVRMEKVMHSGKLDV